MGVHGAGDPWDHKNKGTGIVGDIRDTEAIGWGVYILYFYIKTMGIRDRDQ